MLTSQIATPSTFPKQIRENVKFGFIMAKKTMKYAIKYIVHIKYITTALKSVT
jgi:hypothetical protein